jgi:hypothetical protein
MTFGVQAFSGRTLTPADDQPSASPTALLSYRAWQQEYGADPKVIGGKLYTRWPSVHHCRHQPAGLLW